MSDQNPYQSPRTSTPRKINWAAIVLRSIGAIMLIWWLDLIFNSGIISLNLLLFSLLFLFGPSFPDLLRRPSKREVLREMQQRAGNAEDSAEPSPVPEEFLRQLEQDETA